MSHTTIAQYILSHQALERVKDLNSVAKELKIEKEVSCSNKLRASNLEKELASMAMERDQVQTTSKA